MGQAHSAEMAARRFGLLERSGHADLDPRAGLLRQIEDRRSADLRGAGLMTTAQVEEHSQVKAQQTRARHAMIAAARPGDAMAKPPDAVPRSGDILGAELVARIDRARETATPFCERLALFWTNVFTVSADRANVGDYAGSFERDAIRPHVLGRFSDMLVSAVTHPAMLIYLDNKGSYGPNSLLGRRLKRGVNENLAREIMELHTLGADGGYSQEDVEAFAEVLTGWSKSSTMDPPLGAWATFDHRIHQPGPKTVLNKLYRADGPEQAVAVLRDLAVHPSTARHLARRMTTHFFGVDCPQSVTAAVDLAFRESGGDLQVVTRALVESGGDRAIPARKLRPPIEHLLVMARLLGWRLDGAAAMKALKVLGQPYFRAPSPAGWPDGDDDWASGAALKRRLDLAYTVAGEFEGKIDARDLAQEAFGPWLSASLARALDRAPSGREGLTLLLMSPEVIRR